RLIERRQENADQHSDDADHHQQLDQCKSKSPASRPHDTSFELGAATTAPRSVRLTCPFVCSSKKSSFGSNPPACCRCRYCYCCDACMARSERVRRGRRKRRNW